MNTPFGSRKKLESRDQSRDTKGQVSYERKWNRPLSPTLP